MDLAKRIAALTPDEARELDALLAAPLTFREFVDRAYPGFQWYRAQQAIADALERVARGEIRRLMVFMPPQEGKSLLVSQLFPAYYLHEYPTKWVAVGSYSFALARGFSRAARDFYREHVADLSDDAAAVEIWETVRRGGLWAVGRGGSATGRPAHLFVVDDPLKDRDEAESETIRATLHNWYNSVVRMRLQPDNAVVIVHTRWHEDDLSGHLLEMEKTTTEPEGWHVIELPGIAEPLKDRPKYPPSVKVLKDWRQPGEPLGGRYGLDRYRSIKANAGDREFESQIQQRPGAAAGTILKRDWWRRLDEDAAPVAFDRTIISVDCSFKDTKGTDFVAIHVYGRIGPRVYGRHRVKGRMSFTTTVDTLKIVMRQFPQAVVYVEDKANGSAVIDTLGNTLLSVIPVNPEGGKVARAYACQGDVQHGRVFLPVGEGWDEMIVECASFPNGLHDDDVDAFTQAMAVFREELRDALPAQPESPVKRDDRAVRWDHAKKQPIELTPEAAFERDMGLGGVQHREGEWASDTPPPGKW